MVFELKKGTTNAKKGQKVITKIVKIEYDLKFETFFFMSNET